MENWDAKILEAVTSIHEMPATIPPRVPFAPTVWSWMLCSWGTNVPKESRSRRTGSCCTVMCNYDPTVRVYAETSSPIRPENGRMDCMRTLRLTDHACRLHNAVRRYKRRHFVDIYLATAHPNAMLLIRPVAIPSRRISGHTVRKGSTAQRSSHFMLLLSNPFAIIWKLG